MKTPNGFDVVYNVQIATSEKHKLVIDFEATNTVTDNVLLASMATKAKDILGVEEIEVLADKGYFNRKEIQKCLENGITPYVPVPSSSHPAPRKEFNKEYFVYDKENDIYICPNKQTLYYTGKKTSRQGLNMRIYRCKSCHKCPNNKDCTTNKLGRWVTRWERDEIIDQMEQKLKSHPDLMKKRKAIVEHPFGIIKRSFGFYYQLLRTLTKVNAEFSLTFLAYNMKRVMNIMNLGELARI